MLPACCYGFDGQREDKNKPDNNQHCFGGTGLWWVEKLKKLFQKSDFAVILNYFRICSQQSSLQEMLK